MMACKPSSKEGPTWRAAVAWPAVAALAPNIQPVPLGLKYAVPPTAPACPHVMGVTHAPTRLCVQVWIIGEYAERIDNADELLSAFLDTFPDETHAVQLQLLTATVKLFLKVRCA